MEKKTLALNIIVGANEAFELNRMFESIPDRSVFDEVVIGVNTHDEEVMKVAKKYATKIIEFVWDDNFGRARNLVLQATTATYVMWLDADDTIGKRKADKLPQLKEMVFEKDADVYLIPYFMNELTCFFRERIFRNGTGIKWQYPIHESLIYHPSTHKIVMTKDIAIEHDATKIGALGIERNLKILEQEFEKYPDMPHIKFYLARDYLRVNRVKDCQKLLNVIIRDVRKDPVQVASLCGQFALAVGYRQMKEGYFELHKPNLLIAEAFCKKAIELSDAFAEPWVILGDISQMRGEITGALRCFESALRMKFGTVGSQQKQYYREVPAMRLCYIHYDLKQWESALFYNHIAAETLPQDWALQEVRQECIEELAKTLTKNTEPQPQLEEVLV